MGAISTRDRGVGPLDSSFLAALPTAIEAIGTARFEKHLADAIGGVVDYDFITMARYSVHDKPRFLIHSHTFPSHMAELYLSEFIDSDPYIEHWRRAEEPGVVWLQDVAYARKRYADYTQVFLPRIGVKDEIGVFLPAIARDSLAFFFVNRRHMYAPDDVLNLRRVFATGAALYRVHIRTLLKQGDADTSESPSLGRPRRLTCGTGSTIWFTNEWGSQQTPDAQQFVTAAATPEGGPDDAYAVSTATQARHHDHASHRRWINGIGLTAREHDILELVLAGLDSAGIAARLSLSVGNIKNHKRRIYAKLDISSERELFLRYIQAMSKSAKADLG